MLPGVNAASIAVGVNSNAGFSMQGSDMAFLGLHLVALKASLEILAMQVRQSSVGALPLLLNPNAPPPTEDSLAAMTERSSTTIFDGGGRGGSSGYTIFWSYLQSVVCPTRIQHTYR
ncbi:hypothetical protein MKEN_01124200 [Mycena kentingensis (nom. inval.)]|nr:hypothetical protein MKEN_01124200 [Mycena kentingensis (nom. inval.)]